MADRHAPVKADCFLRDDRAMALVVIAFQAEERDGSEIGKRNDVFDAVPATVPK